MMGSAGDRRRFWNRTVARFVEEGARVGVMERVVARAEGT